MDKFNDVNQNQDSDGKERFSIDDQIMYKNILGEWHEGTILRVNNTTIRILNTKRFKILSVKHENVLTLQEYDRLKK